MVTGSAAAAPGTNSSAVDYWYISADKGSIMNSFWKNEYYPNPNEVPYVK